MPIYEYDCQECGNRSEELQGLHASVLTVCKVCGGPLKKLISAPSFQFKGTGWYVTDYARKEESSESSHSESGNGSSSSDSSGSSSDSSGSPDDSSSAKKVESSASTTASGGEQKKDSAKDSKKTAKESSA